MVGRPPKLLPPKPCPVCFNLMRKDEGGQWVCAKHGVAEPDRPLPTAKSKREPKPKQPLRAVRGGARAGSGRKQLLTVEARGRVEALLAGGTSMWAVSELLWAEVGYSSQMSCYTSLRRAFAVTRA